MNSPEPRSSSKEERLAQRRVDQDRTLDAIQALETALGLPSPRREVSWRDAIIEALDILADASRQEAENAAQPDSLLSDLSHHQPRLRNRVRGLRIQYRHPQEAVEGCRRKLIDASQNFTIADVRVELAQVLTGFRAQRAKESDLLYEAYFDAFRSDLPRDVEDDLNQR